MVFKKQWRNQNGIFFKQTQSILEKLWPELLFTQIVLPMHKKFYSIQWFLKNQIFSLFPIVKMNANYAEICNEGKLEADFQQVLLVRFF